MNIGVAASISTHVKAGAGRQLYNEYYTGEPVRVQFNIDGYWQDLEDAMTSVTAAAEWAVSGIGELKLQIDEVFVNGPEISIYGTYVDDIGDEWIDG